MAKMVHVCIIISSRYIYQDTSIFKVEELQCEPEEINMFINICVFNQIHMAIGKIEFNELWKISCT